MNLQSVKAGDLVRVDKRGQRFLAEVTEVRKGEVSVSPELRTVTYRTAKAREVVDHYRKAGRYHRKQKI